MTTATEPMSGESGAKTAPKRAAGGKAYAVLAAVVALGGAAYFGVSYATSGRESTDDAQVDADVVPVAVRVSGVVAKVLVKDHQVVKKGDVLAELDTADLSARVKQAEAELDAAKAQASAAEARVRIKEATTKGGLSAARAALSGTSMSVGSADAQIAAAQAAVARAEAEAQKVTADLARAEALRKDDAIPAAQLDAVRANAAAARAAVAQATAQLAVATDMKRTAETRVSEAQAHVEQSAPVDAELRAVTAELDLARARAASAEATLALARLQLSYARIEAPQDGVLAKLAIREGQLVQPGRHVVAIVPQGTYVIANFKETQVGGMRPGARARITVDAFPGRTFSGTVESTSPGTGARFSLIPPDNASGNFVKVVQRVPVKIAWSELPTDVHVAAGMSVDVTVITK